MIEEQKIDGWNNKPVKCKKPIYPQCLDDNAPSNYFMGIFCGARGTGKTYLATKLLKTLEEKGIYLDGEKVPQRIILVCSTAKSDSNKIFETLKNIDWEHDIIEDYSDDALKKKIDELRNDLEETRKYQNYCRCWKEFMKKDVSDMEMDDLITLYDKDFCEPDEYDPKPKYKKEFVTHWIIDDMLGTNLFKQGRSAFTNMVIRNRHSGSSGVPSNVLICVQSMMAVPKTIRLNANLLSLFKFANKQSVLNDCYPNLSAYISEDDLSDLYEHATSEPHSALVVDMTKGKPVFKKNLDIILKKKSELNINGDC